MSRSRLLFLGSWFRSNTWQLGRDFGDSAVDVPARQSLAACDPCCGPTGRKRVFPASSGAQPGDRDEPRGDGAIFVPRAFPMAKNPRPMTRSPRQKAKSNLPWRRRSGRNAWPDVPFRSITSVCLPHEKPAAQKPCRPTPMLEWASQAASPKAYGTKPWLPATRIFEFPRQATRSDVGAIHELPLPSFFLTGSTSCMECLECIFVRYVIYNLYILYPAGVSLGWLNWVLGVGC